MIDFVKFHFLYSNFACILLDQKRSECTGYIQRERMPLCFSRKVIIGTFCKNIFNSYIYVLVDNDTINSSVGNLAYKFQNFREYSEITNI